MNWDDLRYVLALSRAGSLAKAAKVLRVDHTTVGRRIEAAEAALGARLFTRTTTGVVLTADADRLLAPMRGVEEAVLALERASQARDGRLEGTVRITSPETFGIHYLAPRLAAFGLEHPGLTIELLPAGEVLDLGRREAELAVRPFRSKHESLVVRRVGAVAYGLYASRRYLAKHPIRSKDVLAAHPAIAPPETDALESIWLGRLRGGARPTFLSTSSLAMLAAARASAGIAVLPRYLADGDTSLRLVPRADAPSETLWLTVHRDLHKTPRVRALLDLIAVAMQADAALLRGARPSAGLARLGVTSR